jgi:FkbM family methyltransferase
MNEFLKDADFSSSGPAETLRQAGLGFIDVGVRGGIHPVVAPVAGLTHVLAFEPDEQEAKRLRIQYSASSSGRKGGWKGVTIEGVGLSDTAGTSTLHITSALTNSSLRLPSHDFIGRYRMEKFQPVGMEVITTAVLDEVLQRHPALPQCGEFIKLDTQGTEYEILQGAKRMLCDRTVAILVEVWFCSPYQDQKLFSELELFLRSFGFSFYGAEVHYRSRKLLDKRHAATRERPLWADAVFLKDPLGSSATLTARQIHVLFVSSLLLGFRDFALELACDTWADGEERKRIERFVARRAARPVFRSALDAFLLAARVLARPWRANVTVGKFVDARREICNYEEVP